MHPNLKPNIRKSIVHMTDEKFRNRTYQNFLSEINEVGPHPFESRFISDSPVPYFYKSNSKNEILSPQKDFFAFYALRNIIRGCLVSCRFIEGGNLLHTSGFYALSTISYYSAAFQILITFLALNGKVLISYPNPLLNLTTKTLPDLLIAKLSKDNNTWVFEGLSRDHKTIWRCLSEVLDNIDKGKIPSFFNDFFDYIVENNNLQTNPQDGKTLLEKTVEKIPDLRHAAIYSGFGFDKIEFENAIKGLTGLNHNTEIDKLSKSLKHFVLEFLSYCLKDTLEIKTLVQTEDDFDFIPVYYILRNSVWNPPFESTKNLNLGVDDIEKDIKSLQQWLHV